MNQTPLRERIALILNEQDLKKVDFARTLGVSANYVSLLVSGKKQNISVPLARLIESAYGYRAVWVLTGEEPVHAPSNADRIREATMGRLQQMDVGELNAVAAYIQTLDNVRTDADLGKLSALTAAERRVYDQLSRGLNARQIAEELELSPNTVKTHLKKIYKKLGIGSRKDLLESKGGDEG